MENPLSPVPQPAKPAQTGDVTLSDLLDKAEPLIRQWTQSDQEKHKRELDLEGEKHRREIELETLAMRAKISQSQLVGRGLLTIFLVVFLIAGGLFAAGRDSVAMEMLRLMGAGALGAFGGYGLGKVRGREEADRK